jgi:hypothetical protein
MHPTTLRALLVVSSLALSGAACAIPTSESRLVNASNDFNQAVRFGRLDIASEYVREIARDEFTKGHGAWGKSIQIADLEVSGMKMRRDGDADVFITVSWQYTTETSMRTTDVVQRWSSTRGNWTLLSEQERSGDKGLIGAAEQPKTDEALPVPPARSHYQTRVIYEQ